MQKFSVTHRVFLAVFILLLNGCGGNGSNGGNPDVQVNELSNSTTSYDETVHINNCGGKADSEQTKSRSFSTSIEGGIDVGIQQVVEGVISAKYSQSRNVSVSQRLVAPAGTNMEFVLRWSEEVHAGNVTVNGSTGTYKANIPVAVEQVSSRDLKCDTTQIQEPPKISSKPTVAPVAQPTPISSAQAPIQCLGRELIAFTSNRDGNDEIYKMNIDGSCVTRLTDNPAFDLQPNWSPDGARIAFASNRDSDNIQNDFRYNDKNYEIYTMNADGTNVIRLTFSGGNINPAWSPDGQRIAYIHSEFDIGTSIQIMNINDSSTIQISAGIATFTWSPDGSQIAFVSFSGDGCNWAIVVVNADGSNRRRIQGCWGKSSGVTWSPDGKHIAVGNNDGFGNISDNIGWWQLYIINPDGSATKRITSEPQAFDSELHPTWSPDSKYIAFVKGNNQDYHICIIYISNFDEKCITQSSTDSHDLYPSWSPIP